MLITVLPMMGDYFTNQLLSGTQSTSMIGNVIDSQLNNSTQEAQGAALSLFLLAVLLAPMLYYVRKTRQAAEEAF
jgi:spermidine/putrescine transport system permease protein